MAKEYAKKFYNGKTWRRVQKAYMISQNYICERCDGFATIVHHKEHITPETIDDSAILFDWENLEAVCIVCHNQEHFGGGGACDDGLKFDGNGQLVKR